MQMTVGYKKVLGIVILAMGCIILFLHLLAGSGGINFITPAICIVIGISYISRPYFIVEDNTIIVKALIGPARRTYTFRTLADLMVDENKIYLKEGDEVRKLPLTAFMADSDGWEEFTLKIAQAT